VERKDERDDVRGKVLKNWEETRMVFKNWDDVRIDYCIVSMTDWKFGLVIQKLRSGRRTSSEKAR
jgi:hypothetical protein